MKTEDFDYVLPQERIAQKPAGQRDEARMLVLNRGSRSWEHSRVKNLPFFLGKGDLLVLNNTKVIPARIFGRKKSTGGKVEFLLLEERKPMVWDVLMRCSRRPAKGSLIVFGDHEAEAEILEDGELGRAVVRVQSAEPFLDIVERIGIPPLPPYISRNYKSDAFLESDRQRYQTLYAEKPGAVAAPTAGLHFTEALFEALTEEGIGRAFVTLHVGLGTFRPVSVDAVEDHVMEQERYEVPQETALSIRRTKEKGGRVVAVGSTTVRTLETVASEHEQIVPCAGRTGCFIYPPYTFKVVDAMLTNFHLPKSTLLMMVSALAGREFVLSAYEEAVKEEYRFYSYGDCMLIL